MNKREIEVSLVLQNICIICIYYINFIIHIIHNKYIMIVNILFQKKFALHCILFI